LGPTMSLTADRLVKNNIAFYVFAVYTSLDNLRWCPARR
jgi:hypothetical protein